jgi:AcrR family transcriptional regulator
VADILAYAGVSRRAFYSHFRDQEQAAIAAKQLVFEHGMEAAAAFFGGSDWPERVWAAGRALAYFNAANPAMARLAFVEFHAVPAATRQSYDRIGAFTMFLEEGYGYREQNRELPRLCSETIAAVQFEVAYRTARRRPAAAELPRMFPCLVYVTLAPFLGPDQAADFVDAMTKRGAR